ncbi:hypothetical protein FQN54_000150 [Arachnomyces sp. PD_36]|nr:hypothetical protein FQN54_000150 [Arachnomyces sp. PD_36]
MNASIRAGSPINFTSDETRRRLSRQRTPPLVRPTLEVSRNRKKTGARFLRLIPITTATLELLADTQDIDTQNNAPLWLTVEVTAAVGTDRDFDPDIILPLDVMVIVDNLATTSTLSLKDAYENALLVAGVTVNNGNDRVAVCGIYNIHEAGLVPFLPLGTHNLDIIKRVFDDIPHVEAKGKQTRQDDVETALAEGSDMLVHLSNRGALCHIFLVTADSALRLPSRLPRDRVQLHTVSPDSVFGSKHFSKPNGFHLAYGIDFGDSPIAKQAQIQKIDWLFKQLRTGYDPGALSDLVLYLLPGDGYLIESILGDTTCSALRPGEKWSVIVKIRGRYRSPVQGVEDNNDRINDLMDQLFKMLESNPAYNETILSACLEYRHSCLPNAAIVKVERNWEAPHTPVLDVENASRRSIDGCGALVSEQVRGCDESIRRNRVVEPRYCLDPLNDELDNGLQCGGTDAEGGSNLDTDSCKSLLRKDGPCGSGLGSTLPGGGCEILGDATNKGRSTKGRKSHRQYKSSGEAINTFMSTPENRKPTRDDQRFGKGWLSMEAEDMVDITQNEWHDVGW